MSVLLLLLNLSLPAISFAQEDNSVVSQACRHLKDLNLAPVQRQFEYLSTLTSDACKTPPAPQDIQSIVDFLRPYIRTTQRKITLYHWGTRGTDTGYALGIFKKSPMRPGIDETIDLPGPERDFLGPVPLRPVIEKDGKSIDLAVDYFQQITKNFFRISKLNWLNGDGLYAATNPLTSADFGAGPRGFLLEIDLPAGERYLDFRNPLQTNTVKLPKPESTQDAWLRIFKATVVCMDPRLKSLPSSQLLYAKNGRDNTFLLRDYLKHPYIRGVLQEVFRQLGVAFVAAPWGVNAYAGCNGMPLANSDVVFTDPQLAERADFRILVKSLEPFPPREKIEAYARTLAMVNLPLKQQNTVAIQRNQIRKNWLAALGEGNLPKDFQASPSLTFSCSSDPAYQEEQNPNPTPAPM